MAFKKFIFLFSFGLSISSLADVQTSSEILPTTSTRSTLSLTASLEIPTQSFLISTDAGRVDQRQVGQRVQYNPTFGPNVGINADYEQWRFGLSKRLYFGSPKDEKKYGKTDYDDYRLAYVFSPYFSAETYFKSYRGFYTDLSGQEGLQTTFNGSSAMAANGETQIIKRSDINVRNYGIRGQFALPMMPFFNAFSKESEKINNFDFNLLGKIYYNHFEIIGDQALVPDVTTNSFSPISSLKEFSSNTLGVGFGLGAVAYASTTSSFGFSALAGPGFQRQANIYNDHDEVNYTTVFEMNAELYYDWKNPIHGFRTGLYFDTLSSKVKDVNFDSTSLGVNLAYSYSGFQF